jgi:hypothetical protein
MCMHDGWGAHFPENVHHAKSALLVVNACDDLYWILSILC